MILRQVDFARKPSAPPLGWWLLAVGALAAGAALWIQHRSELERAAFEREDRARIERERAERRPTVLRPPSAHNVRMSRAQAELQRPWLGALRALESATFDPVYLLSANFDKSSNAVRLDVEAPTFEQAIDYLQRLSGTRPILSAVLVSHEQAPDPISGGSLVRFSVVARWDAR